MRKDTLLLFMYNRFLICIKVKVQVFKHSNLSSTVFIVVNNINLFIREKGRYKIGNQSRI